MNKLPNPNEDQAQLLDAPVAEDSVLPTEPEQHSVESGTTTGKLIQMARIRAKLTLEKLSKITCIRLKYLQAIEDDNFSIIPERVTARGFIKICCDNLGLNSTLVLEQFSKEHEKPELPKSASIQKLSEIDDPKSKYLWMLAVGIVFILLIFLIIRPSKNSSSAPPTPAEISTEDTTEPVPAGQDVVLTEKQGYTSEKQQDKEKTIDKKKVSVSSDVYINIPVVVLDSKKKVPQKQQAKLTIKAIQDAWLNISIDGKDTFHNMLYKGETKTWYGKKAVTVRSPNPADIKLIYNDRDLGSLATENKVVEKTFQRE